MNQSNEFTVGDWVTWRDDWNPDWALKREHAIRDYGHGPFRVEGVRHEFVDIRHYFGAEEGERISHQTCFGSDFFRKVDPPLTKS